MKQLKESHDQESYELDNIYNEDEDRYSFTETSIWYS